MRRTSSRVVVIVLAVVSLLAAVAAIAIDAAVLPRHPDPIESPGWSSVLPGLAMFIPGALLMWRLPWHPVAVVLTVFGALWVLDGPASAATNLAWYDDRDAWWAPAAFWYYTRFGSVLILPIQLLLLLFPDGRLLGGWRRIVSIASIVCGLGMPFSFIFAPAHILADDDPGRIAQLDAFDRGFLTLPLPDEVWRAIADISPTLTLVGLLLALAMAISRRFGADANERAQLRWLVWSGAIFIGATFTYDFLPGVAVDILLSATIALVSASVVIAVTRHRLYDIDRLLSWTLVYGILVGAVVLIDVALIVLVGNVLDDRAAMLIAVVAVTIAYAPLRERLLALASRVVYGRRSDPYGLVSALGDRLEQAADTRERLEDLARTIAEAFASPFVRVELDRGEAGPLDASVGTRGRELTRVPIDYDGVRIGRIEMQPGRRPVVSARDQRLLGDLVRVTAAALRTAELNRELQSNREHLVRAREESRSRMRRDLHDELGPLLAGVRLRLEAARNAVPRDPDRAIVALDSAIEEQGEVITAIRRIVHELRPPALDDLGLARALEQLAERIDGPDCAVRVEADLPARLPAAAEVAAYLIASEGLANARRHADARAVCVTLTAAAGVLRVEVSDDGRGIPEGAHAGLGLRSMRERAEELGGTFSIDTRADGGTLLVATVPLAETHPVDLPSPRPHVRPHDEELAHDRP